MKRAIFQSIFFAVCVILGACTIPRNTPPTVEAAVNWEDIRVEPDSSISRDTIQAIIKARGGKDPNDIWTIAKHPDETITIQKTRKDSKTYPPGGAVEYWHQESNGKWKQNPAA